MYEARVVLDGTSYTAEGASKKEAKQKMAVVALRDKFGLDASELLQTYLFNLNRMYVYIEKKTVSNTKKVMNLLQTEQDRFSKIHIDGIHVAYNTIRTFIQTSPFSSQAVSAF